MGSSPIAEDGPKRCFNAAKSFQLNWYADKHITVSPFVTPTWTGTLVGFVDFESAGTNHVIVKIESGSYLDYYVNFNRKAGFNSGTKQGGDKVMIMNQGYNGVDYSQSTLVATLSGSQSFEITNFGGFGAKVLVSVNDINTSASPAYASITINRTAEHESIYINCGGNDYYDGTNIWKNDKDFFFRGGKYDTTESIANTAANMEGLYQFERFGTSMKYQIGLVPGLYDIILHFCEIYFEASGRRVFDVTLEGTDEVVTNLDIYSAAGGAYTAYTVIVSDYKVNDGSLDVNLLQVIQNPKVCPTSFVLNGTRKLALRAPCLKTNK